MPGLSVLPSGPQHRPSPHGLKTMWPLSAQREGPHLLTIIPSLQLPQGTRPASPPPLPAGAQAFLSSPPPPSLTHFPDKSPLLLGDSQPTNVQ